MQEPITRCDASHSQKKWRAFGYSSFLKNDYREGLPHRKKLRCGGIRRTSCGNADSGLTDEYGTCFDDESLCLDVAHHFGTGFELNLVDRTEVSVNLAIDHHCTSFNLGFDPCVLSNRETASGLNFTFDLTINDERVLKFDGSFDINIGGENIANSGW